MSTLKINKSKICLRAISYSAPDSIIYGQFALESLPIEKTKEFMRALFNLDIKDKSIWFEEYNENSNAVRRSDAFKLDENMTVDKYLPLLNRKGYIRLQAGDPYPNDQIRFYAQDRPKGIGIAHLAWFICDFTQENYKKIDDEFKKAFGFRLCELITT